MGHIIDICAQAFVFGAESELFEATLEAYEKDLVSDQHAQLWKLRGVGFEMYGAGSSFIPVCPS
jgi:hypothetical protein